MNRKPNSARWHTVKAINTAFFVLAISLIVLLSAYWSFVLQPRLKSEAQSNAKILAEAQAHTLAAALENNSNNSDAHNVVATLDQLLLLTDPQTHTAFFTRIALEVDYDAVSAAPGSLDIDRGDTHCTSCFPVEIALYAPSSDELLGLAKFQVSDAFFRQLSIDVRNKVFGEAAIMLLLLGLAWGVIRRLARDLHLASVQSQAANEAKGQFLANMSHEIRTPMNAIIGLSYLLQKSDLQRSQRDYLTRIQTSANSLLELINNILDVSKIDAGKLELEQTEFDLDEVLDKIAHVIQTKASEKQLDILYAVAADVPTKLNGDPLRLGQVLLNLLNNAIKFTEHGEIVVTVKCLSQDSHSCHLYFEVSDQGIGIAPDYLPQLFSAFTQADTSTTRRFGGTGLGLTICRQLVQLMGGEIGIRSELGKGSTFYFDTLFSRPGIEQVAVPIPENWMGKRALVVDDSQVACEVFADMLRHFSFEVSTVNSAEQAMIFMESNRPDLILMDWKLPVRDGLSAAAEIKRNCAGKTAPVILMVSAHTPDESLQSAANAIDGFLAKPVCQSVLFDEIIGAFNQQLTPASDDKVRSAALISTAEGPRHPRTMRLFSDTVKTRNFQGIRLLLVEDNPTNQLVAMNILQDAGLQIAVAGNGLQAVAMATENAYDLILMDVQMPDMDGYLATREIHKQLGERSPPIIAMTAHAMRGDREKCMEAGMCDYVSKPIDVKQLFATLERWLPNTDREALPAASLRVQSASAPVEFAWPEQLPGLDMISARDRFSRNPVLWRRLLDEFCLRYENLPEAVGERLAKADLAAAKAMLHNVKGEAGNLALNALFTELQALEHQLVDHPQDALSWLNWKKLWPQVLSSVASLPAPVVPEAIALPRDRMKLAELARQLDQMLATNNLQARTLVMQLPLSYEHPEEREIIVRLQQLVSKLSFSAARQELGQLLSRWQQAQETSS